MDKVRKLWAEHSGARFPTGLAGMEVDGVDLSVLDADIAGCVDMFLKNGGTLDNEGRTVLEMCYKDVSKVVLGLLGEPKRYFERLRDMARETLHYLQDRHGGGSLGAIR